MARYVWRDGMGWVDTRLAPPLHRTFGRGPMVIRDTMDPLRHPSTGLMMDSKAAFRAVTKAHGCEEIGTESVALRPPNEAAERADLRRDLHDAMQMSEHRPAASVADVLGRDVVINEDGWA